MPVLLASNIILTGFMGTGKSTVGRILARRLGRQCDDIDGLIEAETRKTVNEIFETDGEAFFREWETRMLQRLEGAQKSVISTGGGIVLRDGNWRIMRKIGVVVALKATPEAIFTRVRGMTHRPLLKVDDPFQEIVRLLGERAPFYEKADLVVETESLSAEEVADTVMRRLGLRDAP